MSGPKSNNATIPSPLAKKTFILANKDGVPLQRQIFSSNQEHTGIGNEQITLDGSRTFSYLIDNTAGALNITLTLQDIRNMVNRRVAVCISADHSADITFTLPVGTRFVSEVVAYNNVNTFTLGANVVFCRSFIFLNETEVAII